MKSSDWPKVGDEVELIAVPSGLHPDAAKLFYAGMAGRVSQLHGNHTCDVDFFPSGTLVLETRLLRRRYVDKSDVVPGSTVQCASIQNLHIEVLGEGRTISVSAGQVVDWFDDKSSHTPTSETSRSMSVRLRQAIRRLFDLEKRLQCPGKDAPDHEHLPYIETAARITNDVLAVVDDLNSSIIETVF